MKSITEIFNINHTDLLSNNISTNTSNSIYPHNTYTEIKQYVEHNKMNLHTYVVHFDADIDLKLHEVIDYMLETVKKGLKDNKQINYNEQLTGHASDLLMKAKYLENKADSNKLTLMAYTYAASQEYLTDDIRMSDLRLRTSIIISALIYYYYHDLNISKTRLVESLAICSIFGNIIKENSLLIKNEKHTTNDIAIARTVAATMINYLNDANISTIEQTATMAIKQHLTCTCNVEDGHDSEAYAELNAFTILNAFDIALLSEQLSDIRKTPITFDSIVETMITKLNDFI